MVRDYNFLGAWTKVVKLIQLSFIDGAASWLNFNVRLHPGFNVKFIKLTIVHRWRCKQTRVLNAEPG